MKNIRKILLVFIAAAAVLNGCAAGRKDSSANEKKVLTVKGQVVGIERGKDGYTAKIKTADGKELSATVSSVALESRYREVKVGETIEAEGEDVSNDGKLIRVTSFR